MQTGEENADEKDGGDRLHDTEENLTKQKNSEKQLLRNRSEDPDH